MLELAKVTLRSSLANQSMEFTNIIIAFTKEELYISSTKFEDEISKTLTKDVLVINKDWTALEIIEPFNMTRSKKLVKDLVLRISE